MASNSIQAYFQNSYTQSGTLLVVSGDDQLIWEPEAMVYTDSEGEEYLLSKAISSEPVIKNNKILYPGTYQNSADIFTIKPHEIKHDIILDSVPKLESLNNAPQNAVLSMQGYLKPSEGLSLYVSGTQEPIHAKITTQSSLEFRTCIGNELRLQLPTPIAYELKDDAVWTNCDYSIEPFGNIFKFSIDVPYDWLSEPTRTYPIVIDPTIRGTQLFTIRPGESQSNDTWIGDNSGLLVNNNYGKDKYLLVGGDLHGWVGSVSKKSVNVL